MRRHSEFAPEQKKTAFELGSLPKTILPTKLKHTPRMRTRSLLLSSESSGKQNLKVKNSLPVNCSNHENRRIQKRPVRFHDKITSKQVKKSESQQQTGQTEQIRPETSGNAKQVELQADMLDPPKRGIMHIKNAEHSMKSKSILSSLGEPHQGESSEMLEIRRKVANVLRDPDSLKFTMELSDYSSDESDN